MSETKPKRPTLPPLQVHYLLKAKLEKEANDLGKMLSPYLVEIIENRHNTSKPGDPDAALTKKIAEHKIALKSALEILDSYGERPKNLYTILNS